jgi:hypothetical protein
MACGLQLIARLFPLFGSLDDPRSVDGAEAAQSRATGLVLTQPDGSFSTSRYEKPGQPARFSFAVSRWSLVVGR